MDNAFALTTALTAIFRIHSPTPSSRSSEQPLLRFYRGDIYSDAGGMESGLFDADLGGFLYKKRVARPGGGKSGGYRTLLSARMGGRYVFLHGFPKSDKANITQDEKKALQFAGKVLLELSAEALSKALQAGVLLEVHCEQDH